MSPKIVDKESRRKEIAMQAYEYLLDVGIENFTTDGLIKFIGVGKSSLYNYFKSKDEIVQEIMYLVLMAYCEELETRLKGITTFKEKLIMAFEFYLLDIPEYQEGIKLYKEYLHIYAKDRSELMAQYSQEMIDVWTSLILNIIEEFVEKGVVKKEATQMVYGLICTADGMMMYDGIVEGFSLQRELRKYIENVITLVEV